MSTVVERVIGLFVAPSGATRPAGGDAARSRVRTASVAVLGGPEAARAAAAVARGLAQAARSPVALVAVWGGQPRGAGTALPAAASAASKLRARGHDARAHGRVVHVRLDPEEAVALAELERCRAVLDDVPVVLALCAARGEAWDRRLGDLDVALVSARGTADDALVMQVACARLRDAHPALAVAPITVPPALGPLLPGGRALVRPVMEALR